MADLYQLPMFPLGRVALPGESVPLRVFEPRYAAMFRDVALGRGEFGVVLISRGGEVGGGDDRYEMATATRVVRDVPLGEEQRAIVALATRRIRVIEWMLDEPYPQAMVVDAVDPPPEAEIDLRPVQQEIRRLYALASELGADTGDVVFDTVEHGAAGLWQLAALVPLGEFDRQRLLETPDIATRLQALTTMVDEAIEELTLRLGAGG